MQDDPYIGLLEMMSAQGGDAAKDKGSGNVLQGTVISASPPRIQAAGIELTAGNLMVSHMLSFKEAEGPFDNRLKAGDTVLLATGDMQLFYVICKF